MARLGSGRFPQEYPTVPPSHVLNGGIFALWGLRDVAVALNDSDVMARFRGCRRSACAEPRCLGHGVLVSIRPLSPPAGQPREPGLAHRLHIDQLRAMHDVAPRAEFERLAERFSGYMQSRACVARAFAGKVAFRLRTPRNRLLGKGLPEPRRRTAPTPASRSGFAGAGLDLLGQSLLQIGLRGVQEIGLSPEGGCSGPAGIARNRG